MKHFLQKFSVLSCCFFFSFTMLAQEKMVTGGVTDDDGLPMLGISILIKDTTTGTQSDFDGRYSLQVSPMEVLVFSFAETKTIEVSVGEKKKKYSQERQYGIYQNLEADTFGC